MDDGIVDGLMGDGIVDGLMEDGIVDGLMEDGRQFPALEVTWPDRPTDFDRELLLAALDDHAPTAVEETPLGARVFFSSAAARDRAAVSVATTLPVGCAPIEVPDDRWAERSQASLEPVQVGRLLITPAEPEGSALHSQGSALHATGSLLEPSGQLTIVIRPSMGFGTGHHASTRLCLSLLQRIPLDGKSVLDVGTGSGVLAIAALKLGAAPVRAIDMDVDAIQSARENLDLNDVAGSIEILHCDLADFAPVDPADLITANLTGSHLVTAALRIDAYAAASRGRLILGGLQIDEEPDVRRAFDRLGWALEARADEDGWVGLLLYRG
jgi:ribosomal protein L11 methyltransferase